MSIFGMFSRANINTGVEQWKDTPEGVLVDVRTPQEYSEFHIPGSVNIPLQRIEMAQDLYTDKQTPFFVYCHSGSRSGQAAGFLRNAGYPNAKNIGGITAYSGDLERGSSN